MSATYATMILHRLLRLLRWTSKFIGDNCVQSPYVYGFILDVASNRTPFYAYSDLRESLSLMPRRERKVAKLLLRMANYLQAERVLLPSEMAHFSPFIVRGCLKTEVGYMEAGRQCANHTGSGAIDDRNDCCRFMLENGALYALVMANIYRDKATLQTWHAIARQPEMTLIFDLGYAGVALANPRYAKQNHIIMKA